MRKSAILTFALSAAFFLALTANGQPPAGGGGGKGGGQPGGKGGFGGGFGMSRGVPGQILSKGIQDQLKLTDDQKKVLADLQKDIDTKLDKMLTDEQKAEFKKMKEAPMGGFGGPGGGGFGGGGKGGFGGKGGDKGGDKKKGD